MDTQVRSNDLAAALFGKTRRAVLALFFGHADQAFYLRQVARRTGAGLGAVQREIKRLSDAGIIVRLVQGRHISYQANPKCPVFAELQGLLVKTAGLADVLRKALADLAGRITVAFLYGSMAKGTARTGSDVDVLLVGEVSFAEVVSALTPAQEQIGRDVNPSIYPRREFCRKLVQGHHFLTSVLKEPKVFLVGDDNELAGLAKSGLAAATSDKPARGSRPVVRS